MKGITWLVGVSKMEVMGGFLEEAALEQELEERIQQLSICPLRPSLHLLVIPLSTLPSILPSLTESSLIKQILRSYHVSDPFPYIPGLIIALPSSR